MNQDETSPHSPFQRPTRKRNPDESKKRILDAAERAFALRGYDGARLRDIAQDAGVHHALVHHYFTDKRGLFTEVLARGMTQLSEFSGLTVQAGEPLRDNVERVVGPLYDFFADNRNLLRVIEGGLRDQESVPFELTSNVLGGAGRPVVERLIGEMEGAQRRGEMRPDLPVRAIMRYGLSMLLAPFMMGTGLSSSLGLPPVQPGERSDAKEQLIDLLTGALSCVPS